MLNCVFGSVQLSSVTSITIIIISITTHFLHVLHTNFTFLSHFCHRLVFFLWCSIRKPRPRSFQKTQFKIRILNICIEKTVRLKRKKQKKTRNKKSIRQSVCVWFCNFSSIFFFNINSITTANYSKINGMKHFREDKIPSKINRTTKCKL